MAGLFTPQIDTSVSPERAVSEGNTGGAGNVLLDLFSTGFSATRSATTQTPKVDDSAMMREFQRGVLKYKSMQAQGNAAGAERLKSQVLANFSAAGGDISDSNVKSTWAALSGQPEEELYLSREEVQLQNAMETPEFQSAWVATYASGEDITEQERTQLAYSMMVRQEQQKQMLTDDSISWTQGKRDAFTSVITDFQTTLVGALNNVASEQGVVPLSAIDQAQLSWSSRKSQLLAMKPEGVSSEQWSDIENQMNHIDAQFELLRGVSGPEGIEARITQEFLAGVQELELTPGEKLIGINTLRDATAIGALALNETREISLAVLSAKGFPTTGFGARGEATSGESIFPSEVLESAKGKDANELFSQAKGITSVATPKNASEFVQLTTNAFAAMETVGNDNKRFVSAEGINSVFNGQIVGGIQEIAKSDPATATVLFKQGYQALDTQSAIARSALTEEARDSHVFYDSESNKFFVNADTFRKVGLDDDTINKVQDLADRFYGGDFAAMIQDKGVRAQSVGSDYTNAIIAVSTIGHGETANIERITELKNNLDAIEAKKSVFQANISDLSQATEDSSIQTNNNIMNQASMTATLMDKYEGAGDYDTLFGHSQKNRFNVQVSNMTLGELYDFSSPSGEYGQWVKSQVGRVATPMGRFQFVGSTLKAVAGRMGLPDSTVFTPEVQNAVFTFHANEVISGKSPAGKRKALRDTWEGFKNASDAELDQMVVELEGGTATFGPAMTSRGGSFTPEITLPNQEGVDLTTTPSTEGTTTKTTGGSTTSESTSTPTEPDELADLKRVLQDKGIDTKFLANTQVAKALATLSTESDLPIEEILEYLNAKAIEEK